MNLARHDLGFSKTESRFPAKGTCLAIYSRAVNSEEPLDEVLAKSFPWCAGWSAQLRTLFAAYVEAKQAQNVLDYDDLLLYWAQMVADPDLARQIGEKFDSVLVDEYQDTNRLQASILMGLKPDGRGLTVVGDDAQSIYAFRAASVRNILDFPQNFSPPARNRHAGAQLPLDPADSCRRQWRDFAGRRALHQESVDRQARRASARASSWCATKPSRPITSWKKCWRRARRASNSSSRRCCSAPRITAGRWKSS